MGQENRLAIGIALAVSVIGTGCVYSPTPAAARQCLSIYADIIPEGAALGDFELVGRELRVRYRHRDGDGEVLCVASPDGYLDDTASLNLKADFLWDHPEVVPRLDRPAGS